MLTPSFDNGSARLYTGHVLDLLAEMEPDSVDCAVTSPPYWSLRAYSGDQARIWPDSRELCDAHEWGNSLRPHHPGQVPDNKAVHTDNAVGQNAARGQLCRNCGAWQGALGLEPTVDLYVAHLVQVFEAVKRVLKPTGVLFVNLGDSFAGSGGAHTHDHANPGLSQSADRGGAHYKTDGGRGVAKVGSNLKPKDLCLIPERFVIAMQEAGWWVRSKVFWLKESPMPESVRDRPTRAWEIIYVFTKQAQYFWDQEAVREPLSEATLADQRFERGGAAETPYGEAIGKANGLGRGPRVATLAGRNLRDWWIIPPEPFSLEMCEACGYIYETAGYRKLPFRREGERKLVQCANCGEWDKWLSHFAAFPTGLPARCIAASTSEHGCCAKCGKPWVREVERTVHTKGHGRTHIAGNDPMGGNGWEGVPRATIATKTTGWSPTCTCQAGVVPATVCDPFSGTGSTGVAALRAGRRYVGLDISARYNEFAAYRLSQGVLL